MILKNNSKNIIEITNGEKGKILKVSANKEGVSISLEGEDSEPSSSYFCIDKNSDEYHPFCEFFEKCAEFNKNTLLIDEKLDIEKAPIMLFKKTEKGISIRFAVGYKIKKEIWHLPRKNKSELTNQYIILIKSLIDIKNKPCEPTPINEMAIS